jgi:hypothetical protein
MTIRVDKWNEQKEYDFTGVSERQKSRKMLQNFVISVCKTQVRPPRALMTAPYRRGIDGMNDLLYANPSL